jgi:hypothetical protein
MTTMTDEERRVSEERRDLIRRQNWENNPRRPNRVIPPSDRADDLLAGIGVTVDSDGPINWKALAG